MPKSALTIQELRRQLAAPDTLKSNAFDVLRALCDLHNTSTDKHDVQELVLRALEQSACFGDAREILTGLTRELGLFPYIDPERLGFADRIAYEYHKPAGLADRGIVFHRPQAKVYRELMGGRSVILSAPTSFGKSLVIDAVIASGRFRNVLLVVPTLALIDETRRRLHRLGLEYKIVTHGFQKPADRNVYVLTQERALELPALSEIDFFVIDEFYKLAPGRDGDDRAALLNQLLYKLVKLQKPFYMLGPSVTGIASELQVRIEFTFLYEPYHTVVSELHRVELDGNELETLAGLCRTLNGPTIIFCQSPKRAAEVAAFLSDERVTEGSTAMSLAAEWVAEHYHADWHFTRALTAGIGVHHGRVPRALAQLVLRAFDEGDLKLLICTSTLIEGVNTKAQNIVVFDNKINRQRYDYFTFNNIRGRSGRMFEHFIGHVYLFHDPPQEDLPVVDIPGITQSVDAPESLLIQIEESDLTEASRARVGRYLEQSTLSVSTLRANSGVAPEAQIALAEEIEGSVERYHPLLQWSHNPTWDQLLTICTLIWDYFGGSALGSGSVRSSKQLAFRINQLKSRPPVRDLIALQMQRDRDADVAVPNVLDFMRLWATFHFPRLLAAVDAIQRDVFTRLRLRPGSYASFAARVENLFLDPAIIALDEYGIPLEVARKLEGTLDPRGDLDVALERLRKLDPGPLGLSPFESHLVVEAQKGLGRPALRYEA